MNYKKFEITKKPFFLKPYTKKWHFYYGRGSTKTSAYCESKQEAKAFIDWLVASDYATICNDTTQKLKFKYLDLVNK